VARRPDSLEAGNMGL